MALKNLSGFISSLFYSLLFHVDGNFVARLVVRELAEMKFLNLLLLGVIGSFQI